MGTSQWEEDAYICNLSFFLSIGETAGGGPKGTVQREQCEHANQTALTSNYNRVCESKAASLANAYTMLVRLATLWNRRAYALYCKPGRQKGAWKRRGSIHPSIPHPLSSSRSPPPSLLRLPHLHLLKISPVLHVCRSSLQRDHQKLHSPLK